MAKKVIPLILAGGKGARFWPLSRDKYPKQFLKINGKECLLEKTYKRAKLLGAKTPPYIVAPKEQLPLVMAHCGSDIKANQVITEPIAKNTAAAIYWSCLKIHKAEGDCILTVFPADHEISDHEKFLETISTAVSVADKTRSIVVIGVKPRYIATGFGYVERGKKIEEGDLRYYKVRRFVEKPHREKARRYLKKGTYDWNSGIFIIPLPEILNLFELHLPELTKAFNTVKIAIDTENEEKLLSEAFEKVESISFDVGILEKTKEISLVETTFPWDDVGTYNSLNSILDDDDDNNITSGNIILQDTHNSVIIGDNDLISVIGVRDLVIVQDHGVLLICPRKRVEEIKTMVESLTDKNKQFL
ncbi:MAG: sugar phosphate nucleotidyltransferase [Clostridiales bacterium]